MFLVVHRLANFCASKVQVQQTVHFYYFYGTYHKISHQFIIVYSIVVVFRWVVNCKKQDKSCYPDWISSTPFLSWLDSRFKDQISWIILPKNTWYLKAFWEPKGCCFLLFYVAPKHDTNDSWKHVKTRVIQIQGLTFDDIRGND